MGQAIGDMLPFAIGVAISPIPIIAIILMLLSARAAANSTAFLAGWVLGVTGASIVLLVLADGADGDSSSGPSTTSGTIKLVLGVLCLVLAVRNLRSTTADGAEPALPAWLASIESVTPGRALGLGVLLSAVNPKNLLMIGGGMSVLATYELSGSDDAVAVLVFVLLAVSTVVAPVLVYRLAGARAQPILDGLRGWLARHNSVVMGVLMLVIGVVLIGKGIAILS